MLTLPRISKKLLVEWTLRGRVLKPIRSFSSTHALGASHTNIPASMTESQAIASFGITANTNVSFPSIELEEQPSTCCNSHARAASLIKSNNTSLTELKAIQLKEQPSACCNPNAKVTMSNIASLTETQAIQPKEQRNACCKRAAPLKKSKTAFLTAAQVLESLGFTANTPFPSIELKEQPNANCNSDARAASKILSNKTETFYRRELPSNLHSFTSATGRQLFRKSLASGHAEIYFSLSGNFTMQSEPAFCGLGSLAMVLNALSVDPGKRWKGVWRWYADDMLDCCAPLEQIKKEGMSFDQVACAARCNGLKVVAKRADSVTYDEFIQDLKQVSSSDSTHIITSFSRGMLSQTGDGHFSPIGAYEPESNQVLVLDTARFKYPSYFVDAKLLYDAMLPIDQVTKKTRGYMILSKVSSKALPLSRLSLSPAQWSLLRPKLATLSQSNLESHLKDIEEHRFFIEYQTVGKDLAASLKNTNALYQSLTDELKSLKLQVSHHPLYSQMFTLHSITDPILATLFVLSLPKAFRDLLGVEDSFGDSSLLKEEVERLREQWDAVANSSPHCSCSRHHS